MISCEIVNCVDDVESSKLRYDVRVEIPGVYSEVINYVCERTDDITGTMTLARKYAIEDFRKRIGHLLGYDQKSLEAPKRRRRTKAEIAAEIAAEKAAEKPAEPQEPQEQQEGTSEAPELRWQPAGHQEPNPGEPMERCPQHEAILKRLLNDAYGLDWAHRRPVVSAAVTMAAHAIESGTLIVDLNGEIHPDFEKLFGEMVVAKCQQE